MLGFTKRDQQYPKLRDAKIRKGDFAEIYEAFRPQAAADQAERCSQCGIPFCQVHCPLQNNIPDWLKLTAEGRLREAYDIASATNNFPEICGRICPQDRLCEGNCVIEKDFDSVTIGAVEKYITDTAWQEGWVTDFAPTHETGLSVAIIGAGPAGLAAAEQLRRMGHAVHIYDRYDRVGGLMIYGIPNFKLDKAIVKQRHEQYENSGIEFHLNCAIGEDVTMQALRGKHDAVLVATGVYKARLLKTMNSNMTGILPAMEYLTASNRKGLGDAVEAYETGVLNAHNKHVVVIGGGDTAMDCVRTAVRQQAASVTCLYRRDRENMPGSRREVGYAEEEGVVFKWLSAPLGFEGDKAVTSVMVQPMRLGAMDASGRRMPEPIEDAREKLPADMVIMALGFDAEDLPVAFNTPELKLSPYGTLEPDMHGMTSLDGVFAAGDIVRGASLVVWAIKDGRDVAQNIHRYITSKQSQSAV
ncbi:MAG: NAD(P)-dependent oxidoreductase [Alphaproteobacteria bacterium]|nr:NAD(P)-dependent oxidoreductase [Alphaproteobacteria bacterium]